ncbi:MAG: hypothetical protein P4L76_15100 [Beijerinckiaceae bacterium]|nr:hypothetical protein [Beijerinckiaceae bacterium]
MTRLLRVFCVATAVLAAGGPTALAQTAQAKPPVPAPIDRNGVLILVRQTLTALDQANKTGNYTVFRDLAASSFANVNNAAKLAEVFAGERREHLDLSGVLVLDPQLTVLPEIDEAGRMRMAGFFPSVPTQVNFRLIYEPVDGLWRLGEIGVNISPSGPVAPAPPPAAPPPSTPPPSAANTPQQTAQPAHPPQVAGKTATPKPMKAEHQRADDVVGRSPGIARP